MKIVWSLLAVESLEDIYDYIAVDNVSAASNLVENIFNKVESLVTNASRGRVVPESDRENIRELFEGEYRIIYRVERKHISILTIRNFKQRLPETDIQ